ncbi:hypothetical protein [Paracoccus hibiscisoli]|uniref:Uncharacterized protein n=1 Tax=Paracoccus hibiscisoli TaxID=2023261 RepID=A0A4V5MU08_9RHOB|nr:hypothetical protein [Paracoccus hibiscisoli]TJZ85838.1 hypothetical protein FA740_05405 [Paracoccus hibiscisoli]
MSLANSIGSFAQGFANGATAKKDRAERAAVMAQNDRLIDMMGQQMQRGGAQGGFGAMPPAGGLGYGGAAPANDGAPPATGSAGASAGDFKPGQTIDLWSLMDKHEGAGDYDTLFGHSQRDGQFKGTRISNMTIGQAIDFANPRGAYGQWVAGKNGGTVATPMGRHQIVGSTLKRAAEQMGLDPSTPFNRDTQDAVARHLAANRLRGASSPEAARAAIRSEWVGFRKVPDAQLDQAISGFREQYMGGGVGARPPVS